MRSGTGRIVTLFGGELTVAPGDVFYLPQGLRYNSYWQPDESGAVEWDSFGFVFLPLLGGERFAPQKLQCEKEDLEILEKIKKDAPASPESVGYLYLFASRVLPRMARDFEKPEDKLLEKAKAYIAENLDFSVPELAHFCNMSESSLYAFFREHAKMTPIDLKHNLQLERAVFLLGSTDLSMEKISSAAGFHSAPYFRKIFKDHFGISPTQKRKELHSKNSL